MTGLSVMKDQPDPVALPDDQYPDWLWTLLPDTTKSTAKEMDKPKSAGELKSNEDFRQEKKRLRAV
jgi:large subunit ribosomal protein L54